MSDFTRTELEELRELAFRPTGHEHVCARCHTSVNVRPHSEWNDGDLCDVCAQTILGRIFEFLPGLIGAASIGLRWQENSSLEEWFPLSAKELAELKHQNAELDHRLKRFVALRRIPEWATPGQLCCDVTIDRHAAQHVPMEELLEELLRDAVTVIREKVNQ